MVRRLNPSGFHDGCTAKRSAHAPEAQPVGASERMQDGGPSIFLVGREVGQLRVPARPTLGTLEGARGAGGCALGRGDWPSVGWTAAPAFAGGDSSSSEWRLGPREEICASFSGAWALPWPPMVQGRTEHPGHRPSVSCPGSPSAWCAPGGDGLLCVSVTGPRGPRYPIKP